MRPSVICVGLASMQRIVRVDSMPARGSKGRARGYSETVGGDAAIAAMTAARLGACVSLLSVVGDDAAGREIISRVQALGVGVDGVVVVPDAVSVAEAVLVDAAGQRAQAVYEDERLKQSAPMPSASVLDGARAALADASWLAAASHAFAEAKKRNVATIAVIDDPASDDAAALCRRADHVVFSGTEAAVEDAKVLVALRDEDVFVRTAGREEVLALADARNNLGPFSGAYAKAIAEGQSAFAATRFAAGTLTSKT